MNGRAVAANAPLGTAISISFAKLTRQECFHFSPVETRMSFEMSVGQPLRLL